jgi:hypothetical protein
MGKVLVRCVGVVCLPSPMAVEASDLAAIPLFGTLTSEERDELAGWFEDRTYDGGARLVGEGAAGYEFFVLADGGAVVTSSCVELARLGPGRLLRRGRVGRRGTA